MTQITDGLGITYSGNGTASVDEFNAVLDLYLKSIKTTPVMLDALIESDPDMIMAQCLRGYMLKLAANSRLIEPLAGIVKSLNNRSNQANKRECRHITALNAWASNDLIGAVEQLESILTDYPKDIVALRNAHYLHFYVSSAAQMRDSIARSATRWQKGELFFGRVLGMYAFGLEEAGQFEQAEDAGRQAVDEDQTDAWAIHAVGHVFQMQSRFNEGVSWLDENLAHLPDTNNFRYHLIWHKALYEIGLGQPDGALAIYDEQLLNALEEDFYLDICNATSLLWRLEMVGLDVGDRWESLRSYAANRVRDQELIFSSLHYLMIPAKLDDRGMLERALDSLKTWTEGNSTQGEICRDVGLPLAQAIIDLVRNRTSEAHATFDRLTNDIQRIGGSNAQRELFDQFRMYSDRKAT